MLKVDDLVLYKGKMYKVFFDYNNGQYEIKDPGFITCILVRETEVQKVTE